MQRFAFFLLPALLFLASCAKSPSETAAEFIRLVKNRQFEEAKAISTGSTAMMLDWVKNMPADQLRTDGEPRILRDSIAGDQAFVFYTDKTSSREQMIRLVKVEGKWKVDAGMNK